MGRIHKQNQQNWPYPSPNTTFVTPQRPDNLIETQRTSACDASLVAHALVSCVSDQSTNHHVHTNVNYNDDSKSFEAPRKNGCSSSSFVDTIATTNTPNLSKLSTPGKGLLVFKQKGKISKQHNVLNQEHHPNL